MKKYSIIFGLLLLALVGCRKNTFVDEPIKPPVNDPTVTIVVDVTGFISDENGVGLQNALISVGTRNATTDAQGVFLVRQVELNEAGSLVSVSMDNYFDNYRIVYPHIPREKIYVQLQMTEKGNPTKFQTSEPGVVIMNGGAKVDFSANSLSLESGGSYNGEVSAFAHWYDPTDINLGSIAPANLEGIDKNGESVIMYTYGMIGLELYSTDGEKLQIITGEKATIELPIPTELASDAPEQVPLWSLDEMTGKWVEEGVATKINSTYKGKVSHFSFWNVDVSSSFINIEGYLKLPDGTPVANYLIHIKRMNNYGAYGYTNSLGYFEGYVPNNEVLTMFVQHCGVQLINMEIGPFSTDTDLGDFEVELTDFATLLTASLKGCVGEPLPFAYGLTNTYQFLSPDDDGNVATIIAGCGTIEPTAKFYDGQNINVSEVFDLDKSASTNVLGDVSLCTNVGEYITLSIDGGDYHLIEEPEAFIVNGNRIALKGFASGAALSFNMDVPSANTGVYNPTQVVASTPDSGNPNGESSMLCSDNVSVEFPCDQFTTEILSVDLVANIITGTFEGYLINRDSVGGPGMTEVFVDGSFRSNITDQFDEASISGKVWIDLDEDGTRDAAEEDQTVCNMSFSLISATGTKICFGYPWVSSEDGSFSFEGLRPDLYYIRTYNTNYELADFQVGDPDKDNDFLELAGTDNYASYEIDLMDGVNAENIDLGFDPPTDVTVYMNGQGCTPELVLSYNIQGGLKPYELELSNGDTKTVSENFGTFEVAVSGNYAITLTDALNNTSTDDFDLPAYNNTVVGYVWDETGLGDPIRFDFDTDIQAKDRTISLYNADGSLYATQLSDNPGYQFTELPYGSYYVEVEVVPGFTMVEKDETHFFGGGINPATHQSDVFTIDECYTGKRFNVGYVEE